MSNRVVVNGRERVFCEEHPFVTNPFGGWGRFVVLVEAFPGHWPLCAACKWAQSMDEWDNMRALAAMSNNRLKVLACPERCGKCLKGKA